MLSSRTISLKQLRSTAGGLSWIAGLVRWLRPFLSPLWGAIALAASWEGPPEKATIGTSQIRHALQWLAAFLEGQEGCLIRLLAVAPRSVQAITEIQADASPWGMGATLSVNGEIKKWFGIPLEDGDLHLLGFARGDCRGQALAETLCLAVALKEWAADWQDEQTVLMARSDAVAALGALNKLSSTQPAMNTIVREIAFDLAESRYDLELLSHVPATWNKLPDALSRLFAPEGDRLLVPEELRSEDRTWPAVRDSSWWRTRGPPGSHG